jgi:hypothetical protein
MLQVQQRPAAPGTVDRTRTRQRAEDAVTAVKHAATVGCSIHRAKGFRAYRPKLNAALQERLTALSGAKYAVRLSGNTASAQAPLGKCAPVHIRVTAELWGDV